jgi:hypothetical protein
MHGKTVEKPQETGCQISRPSTAKSSNYLENNRLWQRFPRIARMATLGPRGEFFLDRKAIRVRIHRVSVIGRRMATARILIFVIIIYLSAA